MHAPTDSTPPIKLWPAAELTYAINELVREFPIAEKGQLNASVNLAARAVGVDEGRVQLMICARRFVRALV